MAMQKMVLRRGRPAHIWFDNRTNFVGAEREISDALKRLNKERINDERHNVECSGTSTRLLHPTLVGRVVKFVKRALKAVAGTKRVTDVTLLTFMAEAESLMNCRPLSHFSSDYNNLWALSPNHFLLGRANMNIPLDVVSDSDLCSRERWNHDQVMANHFWERSLHEYLSSLNGACDLVLVMTDNLPRGRWPLARASVLYVVTTDEFYLRNSRPRVTLTRIRLRSCVRTMSTVAH